MAEENEAIKKLKATLDMEITRLVLMTIEDIREPAASKDRVLLEQLARRVTQITTKAIRAIDQTLSLVAASERRIERLTRSIRKKPVRRRAKSI